MSRVLFSPIGGTDPIRYLYDGSMLHICRHYQPDKVILYLSSEMVEKHREDNRYVRTLNMLGDSIGHTFDIKVIENEELIDVQKYDVYYEIFRQEIKNISDNLSSGDELIVNMASGTPAMKSALLILATLSEYKFIPIQVNSPQKKMNSEIEDRNNYDVELNWELNQDNLPDSENRCEEVKCMNLIKLLKIDLIKKFIRKYDYSAAGMVTGGISGISIIIRRLSLIAKESWKSGWLPQSGIPIWFTNIILDIPLFIWAYCKKGIDYIKDTLAADALLTFFMAVLPADTRVEVSYLKTAIIGGIMAGVGIGMVLRTEITTGGTDLLAGLIVERSRYLSVVVIMNIIDALIIIAGAFAFGIRVTMYAILAIVITTFIAEFIIRWHMKVKSFGDVSED